MHHTMSIRSYILLHILFGTLTAIIMITTLFCPLPGKGYYASQHCYCCLVSLLGISGCAFSLSKRHRTGYNLFANLTLPQEVYLALAYWPYLTRIITALLALSLLGTFWIYISVFTHPVRKKTSTLMMGRFIHCSVASRQLSSYIGILLLAPFIVQLFTGIPIVAPTVQTAAIELNETLSPNMDLLLELQEDRWAALGTDEQLNILRHIIDLETDRLGFSETVGFCAIRLPASINGRYSDELNQIELNLLLLHDDPQQLINTICHELYHAYQYQLVKLYQSIPDSQRYLQIFNDAAQYDQEFANYISGASNYDGYYTQLCEVTARDYGEAAVERYQAMIDDFLACDTS